MGLLGIMACHRLPQRPETSSSSFVRGVLVEEFSDWACIPCRSTAEFLDSLRERYPDLVIVRIPSGALDPGDPLYVPIVSVAQARMDLYGLDPAQGVPQVVIQGLWKDVGFSNEARVRWENYVTEAGSESPRVTLELLQALLDPDSAGGMLGVRLKGDLDPGDRVFLMILEDSLSLRAPNGETLFSHILRDIQPLSGEPADTVLSLPFSVPSSVDRVDHVTLAVVLQNVDSLKVVNALALPLVSFSTQPRFTLRLVPESDRDTVVNVGTYTVIHYTLENLRAEAHPVDVTVTADSTTPLPGDWSVFLCVLGRCRNTMSLVDTLPSSAVDSLFSVDVLPGSADTMGFILEVRSLLDSTRMVRHIRVQARN